MTVEIAILIVAAGRGSRFGGGVPKQYRDTGSGPVLARTLAAFAQALPQARIQAVIHMDDINLFKDISKKFGPNLLAPVAGGATRQASVRAGLEALAQQPPKIVLVHDGARPYVSAALIERAIVTAEKYGAAIPGTPVSDTIKRVDHNQQIIESPLRHELRAVQTPQAFAFAPLLAAHRQAMQQGLNDLTDDAAVISVTGHPVFIFEGEDKNLKITHPNDLNNDQALETRVGQGFDVHAFGPGDHVWLGGVKIAHEKALVGHSDADVLLHAITDSLLGALGDGDIGQHFPPSDPKWKGASSDQFLVDAVKRVEQRGGKIIHIDSTLICEQPKIGPHREAIRQSIAKIMGLSLARIAVKATTSEQLGFTGRGEGIASLALATIALPSPD